jgi:hypothetical protein
MAVLCFFLAELTFPTSSLTFFGSGKAETLLSVNATPKSPVIKRPDIFATTIHTDWSSVKRCVNAGGAGNRKEIP